MQTVQQQVALANMQELLVKVRIKLMLACLATIDHERMIKFSIITTIR